VRFTEIGLVSVWSLVHIWFSFGLNGFASFCVQEIVKKKTVRLMVKTENRFKMFISK
jgi:hypothetical protein